MTFWIVISAVLMSGTSLDAKPKRLLPQDLIGIWSGESPGAVEGGVIYIESRHAANGRFNGALEIRSAPVSEIQPVCIEFAGRWAVEGDIITYSDIEYSNGLHVPSIEDRIVSINATTVKYIALYDGSAFQRHRIPNLNLRCDESGLEAEPGASTREGAHQ